MSTEGATMPYDEDAPRDDAARGDVAHEDAPRDDAARDDMTRGEMPRPALRRRHNVGATSAPSLLLTILGEYVLPAGRPVWTSALVAALAGLGVEEKASRQSLARTAAEGFIVAERTGRRVRWHLSEPGRRLLTDGAERIYSFAEPTARWDGRWLLVSVAVPDGQRQLRHQLRTRMSWAGFGSPAPGLWVSPNAGREVEAKQIVTDLGLAEAALSFTGPFAGIGGQHTLVEQAWNLGELTDRYRAFLDEFTGACPAPGEPTLLAQTRLVHEWRRFPFLDPRLPAELLPRDWIGLRAGTLFRALHDGWHGEAQRHWRELASDA
ncbi:PaaX family transcriptional regulator [Rugosimonospora africana]|uniref:PaaX family transcriptional regulator n=1 Tax=Rugosimonospora africana TaxID=556532 RepID=A0A8J3VW13_9ACTN|nr:PaaX family transcriptional regulator C-terminal domain-containing protein [Rugosimonospora africana]GIH20484.1 PaaX family transcriptional regulator [Rugosimonospora africana]